MYCSENIGGQYCPDDLCYTNTIYRENAIGLIRTIVLACCKHYSFSHDPPKPPELYDRRISKRSPGSDENQTALDRCIMPWQYVSKLCPEKQTCLDCVWRVRNGKVEVREMSVIFLWMTFKTSKAPHSTWASSHAPSSTSRRNVYCFSEHPIR